VLIIPSRLTYRWAKRLLPEHFGGNYLAYVWNCIIPPLPRFLQPSHYADYVIPAVLYGKRQAMHVQT